jgi:hypothetical protein
LYFPKFLIVMYVSFFVFCVLIVCKCVLYYCHRVSRINGNFEWTPMYVYKNISFNIILRRKNLSDKRCWESKKDALYVKYLFSRKSWRWCNMWWQYCTARRANNKTVIRLMHFAYYIIKVTNTLRICNFYCFSNATTVTRGRLNVRLMRTLPLFHLMEQYWLAINRDL